MTFKEFCKSRRHVDDVWAAIGEGDEHIDHCAPGFVYGGAGNERLFIHDPDDGRMVGNHWAEIDNETIEGTLQQVERRIYLEAASCEPEWLDDDFLVIYPVMRGEKQVGVLQCCVDGGIRPNGFSDLLPEWISDLFLDNEEYCPDDAESFGYSFGDPLFMG